MAIKYDREFKWGDVFYLRSDPEQLEYNLVNILLTPGRSMLVLRHSGYDEVTVYECETTRKPDDSKKLSFIPKPPDDEKDDDVDDTD